jgi:hypothetical protein
VTSQKAHYLVASGYQIGAECFKMFQSEGSKNPATRFTRQLSFLWIANTPYSYETKHRILMRVRDGIETDTGILIFRFSS